MTCVSCNAERGQATLPDLENVRLASSAERALFMFYNNKYSMSLVAFFAAGAMALFLAVSVVARTAERPRVFLLDAEQLGATKQRIHAGDKSVGLALAKLERDAQKALTSGTFSVVTKE